MRDVVHGRLVAESLIHLEKSRLEPLVRDYGLDGTVENTFSFPSSLPAA